MRNILSRLARTPEYRPFVVRFGETGDPTTLLVLADLLEETGDAGQCRVAQAIRTAFKWGK